MSVQEKKTRVLFLCTHNQARSQMAEAIMRKAASDHFEVYSAGFEPAGVHPLTIKVMEEAGYSMEDHTSKDIDQYLGKKHFGIVITVCANAEKLCPTIPGVSTRLHWGLDDPSGVKGVEEDRINAFRKARDQLKEKIFEFLKSRDIEPKT